MITAELPRSVYRLDALRLSEEAFRDFCTCSIAENDAVFRLQIEPRRPVDAIELGRSFFNYALAASMELRIEAEP